MFRRIEFANPEVMKMCVKFMDASLRTAGVSPSDQWCWADLRPHLLELSKNPEKYHSFFNRSRGSR